MSFLTRLTQAVLAAAALAGPTLQAAPTPVVFPGAAWAKRAPAEVGMDAARLDAFAARVGGDGVVVKDGFLVKSSERHVES